MVIPPWMLYPILKPKWGWAWWELGWENYKELWRTLLIGFKSGWSSPESRCIFTSYWCSIKWPHHKWLHTDLLSYSPGGHEPAVSFLGFPGGHEPTVSFPGYHGCAARLWEEPSVFLVSPGHLHPTHTSLSHVSDRVLCSLAESLSVPFPAQGPSDYNGPKPIIKGNLLVSKILYFTMHCGSHI